MAGARAVRHHSRRAQLVLPEVLRRGGPGCELRDALAAGKDVVRPRAVGVLLGDDLSAEAHVLGPGAARVLAHPLQVRPVGVRPARRGRQHHALRAVSVRPPELVGGDVAGRVVAHAEAAYPVGRRVDGQPAVGAALLEVTPGVDVKCLVEAVVGLGRRLHPVHLVVAEGLIMRRGHGIGDGADVAVVARGPAAPAIGVHLVCQ